MFGTKSIATYAIVLSACASAAAIGCATAPRSAPVGTTTTTSTDAPAYTPGDVVLYRAQREGACPSDLSPDVDFAPRTAELLAGETPGLDAWAKCLTYPGLEHVTVVLVGGDEREGPVGLFLQRAQRVREALAARGVDAQRVVIGATNAGREGAGSRTSTGAVRLEMTTMSTIRAFPPQTKVHYRAH